MITAMSTSIDLWLPLTRPEVEALKWSEIDAKTALEHAETANDLAEYLTAITGYYIVALELLKRNGIQHLLDDSLPEELPVLLLKLREIRLTMEGGLNYADNINTPPPLITGWVARDQNGYLCFYKTEPWQDTNDAGEVYFGPSKGEDTDFVLSEEMFPDLTYKNSPRRITLRIAEP